MIISIEGALSIAPPGDLLPYPSHPTYSLRLRRIFAQLIHNSYSLAKHRLTLQHRALTVHLGYVGHFEALGHVGHIGHLGI